MSYVTNVVLMTSLLDDKIVHEFINPWLVSQGQGELAKIDEYAGGNKAMEVDLYAGAFNHLNTEAFIPVVIAPNWRVPEELILMVQAEMETAQVYKGKT